jgi:sugar O-acyltransferase (sialic acid O-acetyltransferase NeuD family)
MKSQRVYVIGAGGHAKVVISLLRDLEFEVAGIFDDDPAKWSGTLLGLAISGPIARLDDVPRLPGIIAVGDNALRQSIAERFDLDWLSAVHPRAHVDATADLAEGTVVMAGAVIQAEARLGRHVIVNTRASVDHDCVIGDFAHIAPGATLAGNGHMETGVLFGAGAVAVPGVRVGQWTTVGAGAVVVADVPGEVIAKGMPARHFSKVME